MIMFCDWLSETSETKMIIVRDSFFRKTISIVLLSFIVIINQPRAWIVNARLTNLVREKRQLRPPPPPPPPQLQSTRFERKFCNLEEVKCGFVQVEAQHECDAMFFIVELFCFLLG
jgi:hypothetical protein